jgi:hypothetical protein
VADRRDCGRQRAFTDASPTEIERALDSGLAQGAFGGWNRSRAAVDYERWMSGQLSGQAGEKARRSKMRRSSSRRSGTNSTRRPAVERSPDRLSPNRRSGVNRLTDTRLSTPRST